MDKMFNKDEEIGCLPLCRNVFKILIGAGISLWKVIFALFLRFSYGVHSLLKGFL